MQAKLVLQLLEPARAAEAAEQYVNIEEVWHLNLSFDLLPPL